jgi:hypothetical protein
MSEYVSMREIKLKAEIMAPEVLKAYRSGNLDFGTFQTEISPLQELYSKTYQYIDYPELSDKSQNLISLVKIKKPDIQHPPLQNTTILSNRTIFQDQSIRI